MLNSLSLNELTKVNMRCHQVILRRYVKGIYTGKKKKQRVPFTYSLKVSTIGNTDKIFQKGPMAYVTYTNSKGSDQPGHPCGLILLLHVHYIRPSNEIQNGPTEYVDSKGSGQSEHPCRLILLFHTHYSRPNIKRTVAYSMYRAFFCLFFFSF